MIPKEIKDDVDKITDEIINYQNINNLSWLEVYKEILKKLNMEEKNTDHSLLIKVIRKITYLGYDIVDKPFKLKKFR